ncbi:MAG: hypothetical protein ACYDGO_03825 [Smithellaceae bacterium]
MIGKKSEDGFVLIAALMGIMILLALGYFALTTVTDDLKIAARLVGERRAFSAAEAGVHAACLTFNPFDLSDKAAATIDANDPNLKYTVTDTKRNNIIPTAPSHGYDVSGGTEKVNVSYETVVTGNDESYKTTVQIGLGLKYGPVDPSTIQN